ncbi:MAG TPA: hypothetical protein VF516_00550 [Kofleriaceae bacterium]
MQNAVAVVLVLSPAFLMSDWWTEPVLLNALRSVARNRPDHVIIVEKTEVPHGASMELDPHRRSVFWRSDRGVPRTLGLPSVAAEPDKRTYFALVSDLATALAAHLKPRIEIPEQRPSVPGEPDEHRTVFLAECSKDVEDRRLHVLRYLEQAGFKVVPRGQLPSDPDQFETEATRLIVSARLFVQILGATADRPARAPRAVYRQLDIAMSQHREILQWRDPSLDLANVADLELQRVLLRDTVHADSIPAFCSAVRAAASRAPAPAAGPKPSVFVDASRNEVPTLGKVFGERYEHIQWDWHEPKRTELKRILRVVDGVVLYWGHEGSERTQTRYYLFQSYFKALKKSTKRLLIYDGPPEDKPDFQGAGTWPLARARDGREPVEFRDFLQEIAHG